MTRPGEARRFPRTAIATPHYLASGVGAAVLAGGGNAIDATVAANLALGVVAPYLCGFGGDLFAIVWDGALHGYLGAGRAPSAATPEAVHARSGASQMPILGAHTVTVPQAVEGWFALLDRWGTRSFGDLARDAVTLARDGFALTPTGAGMLRRGEGLYGDFADWRTVYARKRAGDILRQPALARLIERISDGGPDAYYTGEVAEAIAATVQRAGGLLTSADLRAHAGEWVAPLRVAYREVEVAELPPPTQGVTALEALRILDGFDFAALDGTERAHVMIEACKLALADRDAHVTDPRDMRVEPLALLADDWIATRRDGIDPTRAAVPEPGVAHVGGTAYLCAADHDGLLVSLIQSNFLDFGSGLHVPEWGVNLQNRGSSFSLDGGSVNVLAPAKRPLHTLIPAMVLRGGVPWLVLGSMGGDTQAQIHAQLLAHLVDGRADPQAALDAPRWRVEPWDWRVRVEPRFAPALLDGLGSRGHAVEPTRSYDPGMGHAHAIECTSAGYAVGTDPRAEGAALGT